MMVWWRAGPRRRTGATPLEATTADGQKVRLFPNGRWEFVDAAKAAEAQKWPPNTRKQGRPVEAQGGCLA
jgi:hypothetical protein